MLTTASIVTSMGVRRTVNLGRGLKPLTSDGIRPLPSEKDSEPRKGIETPYCGRMQPPDHGEKDSEPRKGIETLMP